MELRTHMILPRVSTYIHVLYSLLVYVRDTYAILPLRLCSTLAAGALFRGAAAGAADALYLCLARILTRTYFNVTTYEYYT